MNVVILESDSSSRLKEYISEIEEHYISKKLGLIETNLVGDNSILIEGAVLTFTFKNYVITIQTQVHEKETVRKETLKVAKAIESGLD